MQLVQLDINSYKECQSKQRHVDVCHTQFTRLCKARTKSGRSIVQAICTIRQLDAMLLSLRQITKPHTRILLSTHVSKQINQNT